MNQETKNFIATCPSASHWEKIGVKDHHGICIPLFGIRSNKSCGIGEFTDLVLLIYWCNQIGLDVIQLLPLNETYFGDPSPYNSFSSCALDPIYIGLNPLPYYEESPKLKELLLTLQNLSSSKRVRYEKVRKYKFEWLKEYYKSFFHRYKDLSSYQTFIKQNSWLKSYAIFRMFKDEFNGKSWRDWPEKYRNPTENLIDAIFENKRWDAEFYIFLQYLAFTELSRVKEYASQKGVFLKGDVPILISPDSVDVWYWRSLFDLSHVAGAPPDDFGFKGHKWGFPLFNWERLKATNYEWWRQRLSVILPLYHMYRIDHAVGFFRIWAIGLNDKAFHGKFLPRDPSLWKVQGEENLSMLLKNSPLLPIAEDLGFIPEMVYSSLKKFGICGTKIPRWQRTLPMSEYEPLSLTTLSNHDIEPMDLWWHNNPNDAKTLANTNKWPYTPNLTFDLRKRILHDAHHSASIFHIDLLQEFLALDHHMMWKNPKNERINIAGVVNHTNWRYKYKFSLEEIISNEELKKNIKEIIS